LRDGRSDLEFDFNPRGRRLARVGSHHGFDMLLPARRDATGSPMSDRLRFHAKEFGGGVRADASGIKPCFEAFHKRNMLKSAQKSNFFLALCS
jgi:hypothetical protein